MKEGRIIKSLSGFYYVKSEDTVYTCRGRGVFRKRRITPLVGDYVAFEIRDNREGYVTEIKQRKNEFNRPPIANIDQAIIVCSAKSPEFSPLLLDRFLVIFDSRNIQPIIFITKIDLLNDEEKVNINQYHYDYEKIGYKVEQLIAKPGSELDYLKKYFYKNTTVITGQSGVGKSSILNALNPSLLIETDEISESLGRGKHTTRHVELMSIGDGLVGDTPGFSAIEMISEVEDLGDCFPEIRERKSTCKFRGCLHYKEPKCSVKQAVENGEITQYRYNNYINFLEEIKARKVRY